MSTKPLCLLKLCQGCGTCLGQGGWGGDGDQPALEKAHCAPGHRKHWPCRGPEPGTVAGRSLWVGFSVSREVPCVRRWRGVASPRPHLPAPPPAPSHGLEEPLHAQDSLKKQLRHQSFRAVGLGGSCCRSWNLHLTRKAQSCHSAAASRRLCRARQHGFVQRLCSARARWCCSLLSPIPLLRRKTECPGLRLLFELGSEDK